MGDPRLLARKKCLPCEGGVASLTGTRAKKYLKSLSDWSLAKDAKSIWVEYQMKDFVSAVSLIQAIARVAEKEDHHPDLHLTDYRRLKIELTTHAIEGLSENDFILAAKIDRLPKRFKEI